MATLGIDLASKPSKTAVCVVEWSGGAGTVRVLSRGRDQGTALHDKFLVAAIRGLWFDLDGVEIAKAAIDAPLGWPEPFVDAVTAHQRGQAWPSRMDAPRARYERRATDRFVHDHCGKTPFSVSADKIAYLAMRCAVLQSELRVSEGPGAVDRAGSGLIAEVYPDPALRFWTAGDSRGLGKRESYKGPLRGNAARSSRRYCRDAVL